MLAPKQIRSYQFQQAGEGLYRADEVDSFVGTVANAYEKVYNDPVSQNIQYGRPLAALGSEEALIAALKTIATPVLILGGTEDFISRPDLMVRSAENLKNCKLVIYSGFGHGLDIYEEMADEAEHFYRNWTGNGTVYTKVEP